MAQTSKRGSNAATSARRSRAKAATKSVTARKRGRRAAARAPSVIDSTTWTGTAAAVAPTDSRAFMRTPLMRLVRLRRHVMRRAARQAVHAQRIARALTQRQTQVARMIDAAVQSRFDALRHEAAQRRDAFARIAVLTLRDRRTALARALRRVETTVGRIAESTVAAAQRAARIGVRPTAVHVPVHRAALAGVAAAAIVSIVSLGWLSLFDQATAVPSREASRPAALSAAAPADGGRDANPVLANIELPQPRSLPARDFDMTPAVTPPAVTIEAPAPQAAKPAAVPAKAVATLPAPAAVDTVAPESPAKAKPAVKAERPEPRHTRHHTRRGHNTARSRRQHVSEADHEAPFGDGDGNSLISEARRYLGTNPTGRKSLWCGAFMDMILRKTGHRGGGNLALGYEHYGTRVAGPEVGAIAVMARRGGGHVGVVTGVDAHGNPIIVSGNHNHTVAEAVYPRGRIIAYVVPN